MGVGSDSSISEIGESGAVKVGTAGYAAGS